MTALALSWSRSAGRATGVPMHFESALRTSATVFKAKGFEWIGAQFDACADDLVGKRGVAKVASLVDLQVKQEAWELKLDALEAELMGADGGAPSTTADERLVWLVAPPHPVPVLPIDGLKDETLATISLTA